MLKRLTRKLFILSALVAYLTLAVPSTSAQGSGYELSGTVYYMLADGALMYPTVEIQKWDGSSWVTHGSAGAGLCGYYIYDTGGPGRFRGVVYPSYYSVTPYYSCSYYPSTMAYASGQSFWWVEVTTEEPFQYMDIYTSGGGW